MAFAYEDYTGDEGILRFAEIAREFDFGPNLPKASFPDDFVAAYVNQFDDEAEEEYFLAEFANGKQVLMLEAIDDPAHIHSQNRILADSIYADKRSTILPPGFYSFGSALDRDGRFQLMVCLDAQNEAYGQIFVWKRAYDPLGEGDNTLGLGFVAPNLQTFLAGLGPEEAF